MPGPKPSASQLRAARSKRQPAESAPIKRPKPPGGLRKEGRQLWASVLGDLDEELELDARELDTLRDACAMEDTIAALQAAIERDGEMLEGQRGLRLNPAVTELRQARVAKMRLLAAIEMEERSMSSPSSRRARKAAGVRWDLERAKRGAA